MYKLSKNGPIQGLVQFSAKMAIFTGLSCIGYTNGSEQKENPDKTFHQGFSLYRS